MKRPQWAGIWQAVCFGSQVRGKEKVGIWGRTGFKEQY